MSLPNEKHRAIYKMKLVLTALLWSKKVKLPEKWFQEVRSAIKHAPFPHEQITIDGETFSSSDEVHSEMDDFIKYVEFLDGKRRTKKGDK